MSPRRIAVLGVLVAMLIATGTPVFAEEAKMNALQTALSSTTISGYVDTSIEWSLDHPTTVQPVQSHGFGSWWRSFRIWVRAHGWR